MVFCEKKIVQPKVENKYSETCPNDHLYKTGTC